jgi:chromosome partitioning protein
MRTVAFITQKGGAGKTTLAASVAVAAADAGERVIAFDLDLQASLLRWGERRKDTRTRSKVMVEPLEVERLPLIGAIVEGIADAGFTLAIFDTAGNDQHTAALVSETADLSLLPARPTSLDVEVTAATFRSLFLAKRSAAFVLNQCPATPRHARADQAASGLERLGILAPTLASRLDFQDAMAAGLGVTEYASDGKSAQEVEALWAWIRDRLAQNRGETGVAAEQTLTEPV